MKRLRKLAADDAQSLAERFASQIEQLGTTTNANCEINKTGNFNFTVTVQTEAINQAVGVDVSPSGNPELNDRFMDHVRSFADPDSSDPIIFDAVQDSEKLFWGPMQLPETDDAGNPIDIKWSKFDLDDCAMSDQDLIIEYTYRFEWKRNK